MPEAILRRRWQTKIAGNAVAVFMREAFDQAIGGAHVQIGALGGADGKFGHGRLQRERDF